MFVTVRGSGRGICRKHHGGGTALPSDSCADRCRCSNGRICMGIQHDLLALLRFNLFLVGHGSVTEECTIFLIRMLRASWIFSAVGLAQLTILVSGNTNAHQIIGKAVLYYGFSVFAWFSGGCGNSFRGSQHIRFVCLYVVLPQSTFFEGFLQEGRQLVAHIERSQVGNRNVCGVLA